MMDTMLLAAQEQLVMDITKAVLLESKGIKSKLRSDRFRFDEVNKQDLG